jgi:hypothetical protein
MTFSNLDLPYLGSYSIVLFHVLFLLCTIAAETWSYNNTDVTFYGGLNQLFRRFCRVDHLLILRRLFVKHNRKIESIRDLDETNIKYHVSKSTH